MANTDAAFGFAVWRELLRAELYAVQTNPDIAFYHGDPVHHGGASISTKQGNRIILADDNVIAAGDRILGVIVAVMDEEMDPLAYIAVNRIGDSTVAGYVMVADHPDQTFLVQEDGATTPIPGTSAEMNVEIGPVALNAGNTATGVSKAEIVSAGAATTATLHCRLLHPHPDDTVAASFCRWVVKFNTHQYGHIGRLGLVTTS